MGYNSTLVIMNDALHEIRDDKDFGKKVYDAVLTVTRGKSVDIAIGGFCNVATVIETHHADSIKLIAVGGNYGQDLGYTGSYNSTPEELLKTLADNLGYRVVKKPTKKARKSP